MLAKFPLVLPCFPRLRSRPPAGKDWLHEVTFDGCRVQLHKLGSEVTIYSGHGAELTFCRASIADAMTLVPTRSVIIAGELVGCDGRVNLAGLHAGAVDDSQVTVYCFDPLALHAKALRSLPLLARKETLPDLLAHTSSDLLQYSDL